MAAHTYNCNGIAVTLTSRITNRVRIRAFELAVPQEGKPALILNMPALEEFMGLALEPHDPVDWWEVDASVTDAIVADFFGSVNQKTSA